LIIPIIDLEVQFVSKWTKLESIRHQVAIAGQVRNAETGQPIPDALVQLSQGPAAFKTRLALQQLQAGDRWKTLTQRPDLTHSAIDGSFYFLDLPEGDSAGDRYTLTVSLPATGTRYAESVAESVTVTSQQGQIQRATVDIAFPSTALVGQIQNSAKQPVKLASVRLDGSNESAFSDEQGNYLLSALEASPSTQRTVRVVAQGYQPYSKQVSLDRGKTTTLNIQLN
jgi:hypothetical protein